MLTSWMIHNLKHSTSLADTLQPRRTVEKERQTVRQTDRKKGDWQKERDCKKVRTRTSEKKKRNKARKEERHTHTQKNERMEEGTMQGKKKKTCKERKKQTMYIFFYYETHNSDLPYSKERKKERHMLFADVPLSKFCITQ